MKLIASWSGGKDSCYALHKAQQQGHTIQTLLTMMQDQTQSNFHMIPTKLLDAQSEALNIPITKTPTTPETYEQQFKQALRRPCYFARLESSGALYVQKNRTDNQL